MEIQSAGRPPANCMNLSQLAEKFGCSYDTVYGAVKTRGSVPYRKTLGGMWVHERFFETLREDITRAGKRAASFRRKNAGMPELRLISGGGLRRLRNGVDAIQA